MRTKASLLLSTFVVASRAASLPEISSRLPLTKNNKEWGKIETAFDYNNVTNRSYTNSYQPSSYEDPNYLYSVNAEIESIIKKRYYDYISTHDDSVLNINPMKKNATSQNRVSSELNFVDNLMLKTSIRQSGKISSNLRRRYATYAGATYRLTDKKWDCRINCEKKYTANTIVNSFWKKVLPDSYGYVAHNPDTKEIIVAFRGSKTVLEWIQDFTFNKVDWPESVSGSAVHFGFIRSYETVKDELTETILDTLKQYPDYKIVFTGHSLGGAEAVIAAADFSISNPELIPRMSLVTYGQPRVGNRAFARWISNIGFPIFRVVYRNDIVTHVPFDFMGYHHESQEVWYDTETNAIHCGGVPENPKCSHSTSYLQWSAFHHTEYPGLYFYLLDMFGQ